VALRATRRRGRSLLRRPRFTYEARFADGTVVQTTSIDRLLQGHRYPADAWVTRREVEAACPPQGPGPWIEYATGRRLADG